MSDIDTREGVSRRSSDLPQHHLAALEYKRKQLDKSIHKYIAAKEREYKLFERELRQPKLQAATQVPITGPSEQALSEDPTRGLPYLSVVHRESQSGGRKPSHRELEGRDDFDQAFRSSASFHKDEEDPKSTGRPDLDDMVSTADSAYGSAKGVGAESSVSYRPSSPIYLGSTSSTISNLFLDLQQSLSNVKDELENAQQREKSSDLQHRLFVSQFESIHHASRAIMEEYSERIQEKQSRVEELEAFNNTFEEENKMLKESILKLSWDAKAKEEFEQLQQSKEHAEKQYCDLLSKVNQIRSQLGERLKEDAKEIEEKQNRIEELEMEDERLQRPISETKTSPEIKASEVETMQGRSVETSPPVITMDSGLPPPPSYSAAPKIPNDVFEPLLKIAQLGYEANDIRHYYLTMSRHLRRMGAENAEAAYTLVTPISDRKVAAKRLVEQLDTRTEVSNADQLALSERPKTTSTDSPIYYDAASSQLFAMTEARLPLLNFDTPSAGSHAADVRPQQEGMSPMDQGPTRLTARPKACVRCHTRKIKCDYKNPCSGCVKVHVECVVNNTSKKLVLPETYLLSLQRERDDLQRENQILRERLESPNKTLDIIDRSPDHEVIALSEAEGALEDEDKTWKHGLTSRTESMHIANLKQQLYIKSQAVEAVQVENSALVERYSQFWQPSKPNEHLELNFEDNNGLNRGLAEDPFSGSTLVSKSNEGMLVETSQAPAEPEKRSVPTWKAKTTATPKLGSTSYYVLLAVNSVLAWVALALIYGIEFTKSDYDLAVIGALHGVGLIMWEDVGSIRTLRNFKTLILQGFRQNLSLHRLLPLSALQLLRPKVKADYQRLEWTCSCGSPMYGDYCGSGLETFARKLRRIGAQRISEESRSMSSTQYAQDPLTDNDTQSRTSGDDSRPSDERASTSTTRTSSTSLTSNLSTLSDSSNLSKVSSSSSISLPSSEATPIQSYLELCVNRNKYLTRIGEIPIVNATGEFLIKSDFELFAKIKTRYNELGRRGILGYLYRPRDIRFVYFGIRRGINQAGIYNKEPDEIPPESEVKEGRYHYYECPLSQMPPMDKRTFFHYFWDHAGHAPTNDMTFHDRLPKKLGRSILMSSTSTPLTMGWGIHIIEGPNWPLFPWIVVALLALTLVISVTYDVVFKGRESGFTIGQLLFSLLTAILTSVISYVVDTV